MKTFSTLLRVGAMCVAVLFLVAARSPLCAQATNEIVVPKPAEMTQADLEKFSLHMQEQLQEAKLAIQKEYQDAARVQAEAARAQVAAITDKLNTIQGALEVERQRRQDELQRTNMTLLWVAAAFGGVGLIAMLITAMFQFRTMNRVAEVTNMRAQLAAPASHALLPAETGGGGKAVELSNQRLMSVIDRLERRVFELEHTATKPLPGAATVTIDAEAASTSAEPDGTVARITLMLGKGQSLLDAEKPEEAMACYDEILKLDSNHPEALVKKGAALERLKKDDEALNCYDRAIAADASLTIAYLYKGGVYNRLERYNEALECYEQALRAQGGAA